MLAKWKVLCFSILSLAVGLATGWFLSSSDLAMSFRYRSDVPLAPLSPHFTYAGPSHVPVILVGQLIEDSQPVSPPQRSEWDNSPVQLWKARVRVEHVLQGDKQAAEVNIFYFAYLGGGSSAYSRLLRLPARQFELFFLQPDKENLRTISDGWSSSIIWVRTGSHSNFQVDPLLSLEEVLAELLLSRGDKTTDQQIIDAIDHPVPSWGSEPFDHALKKLAKLDQSPAVQAVIRHRFTH